MIMCNPLLGFSSANQENLEEENLKERSTKKVKGEEMDNVAKNGEWSSNT